MIVSMISLAICMHSIAKFKGDVSLPLGIFFIGGIFETFVWVMISFAIMFIYGVA